MSTAHNLLLLMGHMAGMHAEASLQFRNAEVVSYNKDDNTVVVKFKPDNVESGDLPIYLPWNGTPGYNSGFQAGLEPGALVLVFAFDANWEHLGVLGTCYSDANKAPGAPQGEVWWVHKSGSYVKMKINGDLFFGSPTQIDLAAPLIQLSDSLSALGGGTEVVRKQDLQALIDWINNSLIPWLKSHAHVGNLGSLTSSPATAALLLNKSDATASSVAKAK